MTPFPDGFLWGTATSSYQIEGAAKEDGKGESIWDRFTAVKYNVDHGENGDVACDHYHLYEADVDLIKSLGHNAYRFSISWPRVMPDGRGKVNAKGLDFYSRLVDKLLGAGITPMITLYHWDLPQALEDQGGWPNRDIVEWFADYAKVMYDSLGDRVKLWATLNEPWCTAFRGYAHGRHAPGICDYSKAYQAAHHLLMAHGRAVQVLRQGNTGGEIGIVLNPQWYYPASDKQADIDACQRAYEENTALFLDPIYNKHYPEYLYSTLGKHHPQIELGDMEIISQPMDFLGVNYYMTFEISHDVTAPVLKADGPTISDPGFGRTTMNWGIAPSGISKVLENIQRTYKPPKIHITENGTSLADVPDENGYVADWGRVDFIREHLRGVLKAREAGVNVQGYFAWSLMDNFEWARGYAPRFGLVRVDYETGKRTPKASALWYRDLIASNGAIL